MSMPEQVTPHFSQRRRYRPAVGHTLTVDLPGESVRAQIETAIGDDACVCIILSTPIATPRHSYVAKDRICVRRDVSAIGIECWVVVSDRELQQQQQIDRFQEDERALAAEEERERIAIIREKDLAAQAEVAKAAELAATPWFKRPK